MSESFGHADASSARGDTPGNLEARTFPAEPPGFDAPPLPSRFSTDPMPRRSTGSRPADVVDTEESDTLALAVVQTAPAVARRPVRGPRGVNPGLVVALAVVGSVFSVVFVWQLMGL